MEKYIGNYIGVVVQNNDPEMRGRVKVFVPNISSNVYENWNKDNTDKIFNFVDSEDLQKILNELKNILPWAEYAGPVFGGCASGRYNATLKKGIVSDSNAFENEEPIEGYRPLTMFINDLSYPDAFSATGKVGNNMVNPYAYQYIPSNYSNLARGMFSIPNVGSHVWVWFIDGDSNYPVYFASAYGAEDFKRIYTMSQKTGLEGTDATSLDYPATYENKDVVELNADSKAFRSKHVINSNKNTIEMVDTDGYEKIKMTQYSGSFLEFNNDATIRLASGNDQLMALGDTFYTHWKNKSEYVGGVRDLLVKGDSFEKIGTLNSASVNKIYELYKHIHDIKTLFDVKRTTVPVEGEFSEKNVTSPFQDQQGGYGVCPVCGGLPYSQSLWKMSPMLFKMCLYLPLPFPGFAGLEIFVPGLAPFLEINGQIGYTAGRYCPLCNRQKYTYPPSPWQVGLSPSTENGFWNMETLKQTDGELGDLYKSATPQILDLQSTLGDGGDKITNIARNHVVNVGLTMNDLQSYRVDARGKLKSVGLFVAPEKTMVRPEATPHVEHVDVDALPGGDYIVTAGNKMKFLVGANGINIKTFGPIEMYGSIANITSEQMNLLSKHELFIDGGEKLTLRSRNITLNPFEHNPVFIDGGTHVGRNLVVQGGGYVEGEFGVQHMTAPEQWYQTEDGGCLTMLINTLTPIEPPPLVPPHIHPIILQLPDHKHWYKNIPLTLTRCKEETRDTMIKLGINNNTAIPANPIVYPNEEAGSNVLGRTQSLDQMTQMGIDPAAMTAIFDAIDQAVDTTGLEDIYAGTSEGINNISSALNATYDSFREQIDANLTEITNALANTTRLE